MPSTIVFNPVIPMPIILGVAVLAATGIVLAYTVGAQGTSRGRRGLLALIRFAALAVMVVILIRPMALKPEDETFDKPPFAVLIDSSESMNTEDVGQTSRFDAAVSALSRYDARLLRSLGQRFNVKLYRFGETLQPTSMPLLQSMQEADGKGTHLSSALLGVTRGQAHYRPRGVLLVSDGRSSEVDGQAAVRGAARYLRTAKVPVWTVPVGTDSEVKDLILVARLSANYMLVGQPASIQVSVTGAGYTDWSAKVNLFREGEPLTSQQVNLRNGHAEISFPVREPHKGVFQYRVQVEPLPGEADDQNNERSVIARVADEKARVLVVEASPHWDSKFLLRCLRADMNIEVTSIFHINPSKSFAIVEEWSQDGGVNKSVTPGARIPQTRDEMYQYDCIFLGKDIDDVFTSEQMRILRDYVAQRAGSVVFFRGKPYTGENTLLAPLEPVQWATGQVADARFKLTSEGKANPIFDYEPHDNSSDAIIRQLPSMTSITRVEGAKSLAVVLAQAEDGGFGEEIATVAYHRYGKGKVMTIGASGLWQWGFLPDKLDSYDDIYSRFWGQMVRWLISDSEFLPGQDISFTVDKNTYKPGEMVRLAVHARMVDPQQYLPYVDLIGPDGTSTQLALRRQSDGGGAYAVRTTLEQQGEYKAVLHNNIGEPKEDIVRFTVYDDSVEARCIHADRDLLNLVAEITGAESLELGDVGKIPEKVEQFEQLSRERVKPKDIWDRMSVFGTLICAFGAEWLIRRLWGLV